MKKFTTLFVFLVLVSIANSLYSQKTIIKFGKIPEEDLKMTKYLKDTTAGAVVLSDFGSTRFVYSTDKGFTTEFTRHVRIKVFEKRELSQADFSVLLYVGDDGKKEDIALLKAFTFNVENGKEVKTKMEKESIFEEIADKNHKKIKFSLPNVKEGSILEVTYQINSPFLFNLNNWKFQSSIPTIHSEYEVFMPEYFTYKNWTTGYIPIKKLTDYTTEKFSYRQESKYYAEFSGSSRESGGNVVFEARIEQWTYVAEDIPAFVPEPYITTINDYLAYVEFELVSYKYPGSITKSFTTTWEKINEELMDDEDFGKQLKKSSQFKEIIAKISTTANDPQSRMIMAYELIKNKLVWDGRYRYYSSSSIEKAFNKGGGSSADINLNLIALLREIGLKANPVLVSTRSNGMLKPGQVIKSQFNHVIASVQLDDKLFLLDATEPYCPYFILPPNTLNDKGLMVSETGYKWVDLYSKLVSQHIFSGQFSMNNELGIEGEISSTYDNFVALQMRKDIKAKTNIEEYKKDLEKKFDVSEITDLQIDNIDSIGKPMKLSMNVKMNDRNMEGAGMVYFNPVLFDRIDENYFKKDTREYPVDFNYPFRNKYIFSISILDGYEVVEIPKNMKIVLPDNNGKFSYTIGFSDKTINLICELSINQTLFPSTNYPDLKKFYEMVVAKMAEQVVLKKVI